MAREFILSGAPGAGKTLILRALEADGVEVVEEAATDVIALLHGRGVTNESARPEFIEEIARLQLWRMQRPTHAALRVWDRSLVCTLALAEYLGHPVPEMLSESIRSAMERGQFEKRVLFVELLGFIIPTAARRISLEGARRFEQFHVDAYERLGFELVRVPPLPLDERVALVRSHLGLGMARPMNGN